MRKLILLVATTATLLSLMAPGALAQEAAPSAEAASRATVVVLVDQSGSLNETDLAAEVRAVRMLTSVPGIDLFVLGFASQGTLPAWEIFCEPGDAQDTCTQDISLRTNAEGNDTDHAAALAGADFVLSRPGTDVADTKIVLMMTDGRFDPNGFGAGPEDWVRLEEAQGRLQSTGAEVWPLGFGKADKTGLDKLASPGPNSCDEPSGVIVDSPEDLLAAVNEIFTNATCSPDLDGDLLDVPSRAQSVTLWYLENELPNGEVTVTNESGRSKTVACVLDDLAGLWTCTIPTDELGPGDWKIMPPPELEPFILLPVPPVQPVPPTTTTTTVVTTTTVPALPVPPVPIPDDLPEVASSMPWVLGLGGLLALGVLLWALLRNRSKLERGVVAVRMAGQSDWSPEETVRAEKRQAFEVDPDSGYPSIEATSIPAPDVVLEATPKGIFVSGSLVEERSRITLGDEIPLLDGMTLIYARTLDDDLDDVVDLDDMYEDSFI